MTAVETSLAATLRVWRDRLTPAEVGLPAGWSRRAVGLRREQLADLAGLSVDYVVRLEQGRATTPSGQVVAALARALQLTPAERDHLYSLAGLQPPGDQMINDHITPGVQRLLTCLGDVSVAVFAADWRLVWWNYSWAALLGDPSGIAPEDRSLVKSRFPILGGRRGVESWPVRADNALATDRAIVADLRRASARYPEDRRLAELLRRTIDGNAHFAELDPVVTTSSHDARAVRKGGLRKQVGARPALRQIRASVLAVILQTIASTQQSVVASTRLSQLGSCECAAASPRLLLSWANARLARAGGTSC